MHLLVTETRSLDEAEAAVDLAQSPADLVFLSFSDSDLGAAATAWAGLAEPRPTLRLANLGRLRHPMSVDLYLDRVVAASRCVIVRLLGSLDYWRYGAEEISALCRREGIALAMLPGDGRDDGRLAALSTVPAAAVARLDAFLRAGGAANLRRALGFAAHLGGIGADAGDAAEDVAAASVVPVRTAASTTTAAIVFYRSHLLAGDTAPIDALAQALAARGLEPRALAVTSLKDPEAANFVAETLRAWRPSVVLNATGFSARRDDTGSPLDEAGAPVLQLVLGGANRKAWAASARGLSQADLAMQVVLPELDGRLLTGAISFKAEDGAAGALEWARMVHRPDAAGIALAADRAAGWGRLAGTEPRERRLAIVLSDYPGGGQRAHAVGLDTIESLARILRMLADAGYAVGDARDGTDLVRDLCDAEPRPFLAVAAYETAFAALPAAFREAVCGAWGAPSQDPAVADGAFRARYVTAENATLAVQPDRGAAADRRVDYHDLSSPPRHAYVAFYLWLRQSLDVQALVHLGTHGTLEWLPGKAVALSESCAPVVLSGGLPVIYPFIVNNPGEAACAKRRLGAVTIGHLTPPLRSVGAEGPVAELERLVDEYAAADGLDRRRTALLRREILDRAESLGLTAEAGIARDVPEADALARLDAYLCDVKDLQVRDGLHVFGTPPTPDRLSALLDATRRACPDSDPIELRARLEQCAAAERDGLLAALNGRFVAPGPGGAPSRGRADVLPTGRNLTAIDPRGVPTRSAMALAERAAADLLRRHRQDHGDWPRALMIDLWGSATMRTGGEDLALAFILLGARPVWDGGSGRVSGVEILPIAVLDRPRVDVTLRISGLFRDAFPGQITLFDEAVRAVAARDEVPDWNPLAAALRGLDGDARRDAAVRIFGAAPGSYGTGLETLLQRGAAGGRAELGAAFLAGSAYGYGVGMEGRGDAAGFAARVGAADAFVHLQDHRDTDVLDGATFAAHEGGFAAAAESLGGAPALYHTDTSRPDAPRTRLLAEEIALVARGRAGSPSWVAGMMRHGYRGAAEIARGVDGLHAFASTLATRFDTQFDLVFDATLGDAAVDAFLRAENPAARAAMQAQFRDAQRRGLWRPHRNAVAELLDEAVS